MEQQRTELAEAVQLDEHGIAPIPAADRTSTPLQQFWIWSGANIAPINWILGALGIILGLSVVETLLVLIVGNLVGCAFFGLFCVMGHRTGVNWGVPTTPAQAHHRPDPGGQCGNRDGVEEQALTLQTAFTF